MNRIAEIFKLQTREGRDKRLKELLDKRDFLTNDECNLIAVSFEQRDELITYNLIWILLLHSNKIYSLKNFCTNGIEENLTTQYEKFTNWDANYYISCWAFKYLTYLFPNDFDKYFEQYYPLATNSNLKMSMAECVFKRNKEKGLELMIDILPLITYDHNTWDSIGLYVWNEGTRETIKYLEQKIIKEKNNDMKIIYKEMIDVKI